MHLSFSCCCQGKANDDDLVSLSTLSSLLCFKLMHCRSSLSKMYSKLEGYLKSVLATSYHCFQINFDSLQEYTLIFTEYLWYKLLLKSYHLCKYRLQLLAKNQNCYSKMIIESSILAMATDEILIFQCL